MKTLKQQLSDLLGQALSQAFPDAEVNPKQIEITLSTQPQFGHYQCNSAMRFGKALDLAPRDIAVKWLEALPDNALIAQQAVAGPGFINLWLAPQAIADYANRLRIEAAPLASRERVVIDFSSPNIAKQMHVGHLRSTIIGDALARIFEYMGFDVLRLNHLGDWGTAFGMLIAYLKAEQPDVLTGQSSTDLTHLVNWYRAAKKRFDEDESFKKTAQLEVVALQSGEQAALHAWQLICDISRQDYQQIYDLLDVRLQERGESFYNPMLANTVQALTELGLVTISDGARCIFLDGFSNRDGSPLPLIIQKSDGGYNYASTDLAAVKHRVDQEKAQRILYLTDAGQAQHFAMVFQAADKAGFTHQGQVRLDHVPFGLVLGSDGKKFKTRSGDTEPLINLLLAAIDEAKGILLERQIDLDEAELNHLAHVLGINAIKYADLSTNRLHDYVFSYEKMLRFEGNTAAFLMYAYVRTQSIQRRIGVTATDCLNTPIELIEPAEIELGLHLTRFEEVLNHIVDDLYPNRLCEYLFQLAEKFHAFFRDCRVEGSPYQAQRLHLSELTAQVLKQGMSLLGLHCVEKM